MSWGWDAPGEGDAWKPAQGKDVPGEFWKLFLASVGGVGLKGEMGKKCESP